MRCTIGEKGLRCSFHESQESVDVFFNPVLGPQKRVASCSQYEGSSTCHNALGFSSSMEDPKQVLVTVPDSLKKYYYGSFYCRAAGGSSVTCQWNAEDYGTTGPPEAPDYSGIISSTVFGTIPFLCFSAFIVIRICMMYNESKGEKKGSQYAASHFTTDEGRPGKTSILRLVAKEWVQQGKHVYIVSSSEASREICTTIREELQSISSTQPELLQYDFTDEREVQNAVDFLSQKAERNPLYVLAYETDKGDPKSRSPLRAFYDEMLIKFPDIHLWAASSFRCRKSEGKTVAYICI